MKSIMHPNELYLDLLKKSLTDTISPTNEYYFEKNIPVIKLFNLFIRKLNYSLCKKKIINQEGFDGKTHSPNAMTLLGYKRLECIKSCYEKILVDNIPGDILEAGVWKGGATIYMSALLKVYNDTQRKIYAADSFEGCPPATLDIDKEDNYGAVTFLKAGIDTVKDNFRKYNLLDDQVVFLKGWFKDTLPYAPFSKLSLLRADGDMYESTMDILVNAYDKVSPGGFILLDDYGSIPASKHATDDFRTSRNIKEEIIKVDWTGVYWRKSF